MHPASIGHYQIERELGRGGMGEVFLARDPRLDRQVAIKALPAHLAGDPNRLARFQREAKVLASLNDPGIGAIYGMEEAGGHQYLILEYVAGETLADRLARGPMPVDEALAIAKKIAQALEVAHDKGIVHRDLKPGNVMVGPDGLVKVLDFGLARSAEVPASSTGLPDAPNSPTVTSPAPVHSPTIPGAIMGTAGYMSPEQARGKAVDKRSDIFSFGCVLYEMLAGAQPFHGETTTDSLGAILHREPDWARIPSHTPATVRLLLRRCLAKDRNQRVHDIADTRIELQAALDDPASGLALDAGPGAGRAGRRGREALAWTMTLLCALAALGAGFAWLAARASSVAGGPGAFRLLNFRPEAVFRAAFGPDGKTIVYCAAPSGNTPELFIVRPESPEPQPLGLMRTHLLSVSSKGDLAVLTGADFVAHNVFKGVLARVPMGGGAPRALLENVRDATWAPDGERLAIIRDVDGKDRLEFPIGTVLLETAGYFSDLHFNPAGDRIAYFEHPWKFDNRGWVKVVDLRGKVATLAGEYWGMEGLAWAPDGAEVHFSASSGGEGMAVFAATLTGTVRRAYFPPGSTTIHDVSRNGRWLITQDSSGDGLMVRSPGADSERDLAWLGNSWNGALSDNRRTLAFTVGAAAMGPRYGACVRGTDGSPVVHLGEGGAQDISRDGKWVLAMVAGEPPTLVAYPVGAGEPVRFERGPLTTYSSGRWFRDGSRVLIYGAEPGKGSRHYVQDFKAGSAPRPVTPERLGFGRLAPDERSILARGPTGTYAFYPIDGGDPRPVKGLTATDLVAAWHTDGVSVLVARSSSVPCVLERVNLESGVREPFATLAPPDLAGVVSVSPPRFSSDLKSYAYDFSRAVSKLYVAEPAR